MLRGHWLPDSIWKERVLPGPTDLYGKPHDPSSFQVAPTTWNIQHRHLHLLKYYRNHYCCYQAIRTNEMEKSVPVSPPKRKRDNIALQIVEDMDSRPTGSLSPEDELEVSSKMLVKLIDSKQSAKEAGEEHETQAETRRKVGRAE